MLILALLVTGVGLLTILSATFHDGHLVSRHVVRQATWAGLGLIGMVVAVSIDYRTLNRYAYAIYGLLLVSLILVLVIGVSGGGARRWLGFGPVALQPSEFMKVGVVLVSKISEILLTGIDVIV